MTDLPKINGYNDLMVVLDKMGKLSQLVPCRAGENQLTAPEVAKLFFENWVRFFGVPKYVIHDGMYVSQHCSGRHCGALWVLIHCLVMCNIPRLMVRPSDKIERLSR